MQESQTGRELVPVPHAAIIPLAEVGLGPLEQHVGLTMEFWDQVSRFTEIMTPNDAGEMSGIGRVEYTIQPGRHPVVERKVYSDTSLYLKISVIPGRSPGTGIVQLRFDSVGIRDISPGSIDEVPEILLSQYHWAGPLIEFEELQKFVRNAFPGRKCELKGLNLFGQLREYSRNFLRVKREAWEKFYWKQVYKKTQAVKDLRYISNHRMWELRLEGQKIPLLIFSNFYTSVMLEAGDDEEIEFEARIVYRVPHIFFQGTAAEVEHVLRTLNDLLPISWAANFPGYKRRPTTKWQRWYTSKEPFPG